SHAGAAVVEGHARAVRRRCRDGDDPQLRARLALAQFHGDVRVGFWAGLYGRGDLVLPGGDLHRYLCLRLGANLTTLALAGRRANRDHRLHWLVDGDQRERVDEPPD